MTTLAPATDDLLPAQTYARLLLQLDDLMQRGLTDSEAADAVRDAMDAPWAGMSDLERERMRGLSADLYDLSERRFHRKVMSATESEAYSREAAQLFPADLNDADPDRVLTFLRQPAPEHLALHATRFLQALAWMRLGNCDVAIRFMRDAERLDPSQRLRNALVCA